MERVFSFLSTQRGTESPLGRAVRPCCPILPAGLGCLNHARGLSRGCQVRPPALFFPF
ncbi:hypothetical protein Apau_0218 [Aminomonas paucivorans DSM 12260]|uniref:Uncharacterized protein n=1 Tax=Aminomonas paucivorans DSM 12260 TaxID=584708 RepID=E3CXR1_9BACT|nr:hypothetical protein [Aminomonas paucivorans]EFQ22654.1 hypothetical protein Apau_0218 [Aminomonas paucivorans DSM 12260]